MRARQLALGAGVGMAILTFTVTACGAAEPVASGSGFELEDGDTRVYAAYRQTSSVTRKPIELRSGSQHVRDRADCIGKGEIRVSVFGSEVAVPCRDESAPGGYVALSRQQPIPTARETQAVVHAPEGAVWSLAIDVGSGPVTS